MDTRFFACTLILLFGAFTIEGLLVCPNGWHKHTNNQCYWFSDFSTTKHSAESECELRNSSLVITDNVGINMFLQQHILNDKNISYWIGLSIPNLQRYAWQWTSGLNLDTRHVDWCDGEGVNGNFVSACAVAYYFRNDTFCLKNYACYTSRRFVCEIEIDRHALCPSHLYNNSYGERRSCYFVSVDKETHTGAAKVCWSKGMRLVAVPDVSALRFMESISLGDKQVYWVGLSPYKWVDGSAYNWNNWGYVPYITVKCTAIKNDGTWDSATCSDLNNVICQKGAAVDELSTITKDMSTSPSSATSMTYFSTTKRRNNIHSSTYEMTSLFISDPVTSSLGTETYTPLLPLRMKCSTKNTEVLFIIIGIMSVVIVGLTVVVGFLLLYIKRILKSKQSTPSLSTQHDILYEDTSAAGYYNLNAGASVVKKTELGEQIRHNSELKTDASDVQKSTNMYEELATGPYVNGLQQGLPCPYATLE